MFYQEGSWHQRFILGFDYMTIKRRPGSRSKKRALFHNGRDLNKESKNETTNGLAKLVKGSSVYIDIRR